MADILVQISQARGMINLRNKEMLEFYVNIMNYVLYKWSYKFHLFSHKFNPIVYLYKIPFLARRFQRNNSDPLKTYNNLWGNPDGGFSTIEAGVLLFLSTFLYLFSGFWVLFFLMKLLFGYKLFYYFIFVELVFSYAILYYYLQFQDKYLDYFKKFQKTEIKLKYKVFTVIYVLGSFLIVFLTLYFFDKNLSEHIFG